MHLLGTVFVKHLHIVAQLGATDDTIVAESHFFAFQNLAVGNELHLSHMLTLALVDWHETARPSGRILHHTTHIRYLSHIGISQSHANA